MLFTHAHLCAVCARVVGRGGPMVCVHMRVCAHESEPWLWELQHGDISEAPTPSIGVPAGSQFIAGSRNSNQLALPMELSSQTN